jgi:hypothetical protein
LPWATTSESMLKDLLENAQTMSIPQQKEALAQGILSVVGTSAPKNTELLMRYVLNRALKISSELQQDMTIPDEDGIEDQVTVLKSSIELALNYYQSDLKILKGAAIKNVPRARFGIANAELFMGLDRSLFASGKAQYNIAGMALGLLEWDLYSDENQAAYAPIIMKIYSLFKRIPQSIDHYSAADLQNLREMNKVYVQAKTELNETLLKLQAAAGDTQGK